MKYSLSRHTNIYGLAIDTKETHSINHFRRKRKTIKPKNKENEREIGRA